MYKIFYNVSEKLVNDGVYKAIESFCKCVMDEYCTTEDAVIYVEDGRNDRGIVFSIGDCYGLNKRCISETSIIYLERLKGKNRFFNSLYSMLLKLNNSSIYPETIRVSIQQGKVKDIRIYENKGDFSSRVFCKDLPLDKNLNKLLTGLCHKVMIGKNLTYRILIEGCEDGECFKVTSVKSPFKEKYTEIVNREDLSKEISGLQELQDIVGILGPFNILDIDYIEGRVEKAHIYYLNDIECLV